MQFIRARTDWAVFSLERASRRCLLTLAFEDRGEPRRGALAVRSSGRIEIYDAYRQGGVFHCILGRFPSVWNSHETNSGVKGRGEDAGEAHSLARHALRYVALGITCRF